MPEISDDIDECWKQLIKSCWNIDPSKRPTFAQIATLVEGFPLMKLEECDSSKMFLPPCKCVRCEYYDDYTF